jgi:hypothetical protein
MTKYLRPSLDCGYELKDFSSYFLKLVPKKKGGLLPNGKLMDFFKVEINLLPHGKKDVHYC